MGYIHNISAVIMANDVARRREKVRLSKLQQELYELIADAKFLEDWVLGENEPLGPFLEDLKKDISGMNAAELRHNIKVWKETDV